MDRKPQAPRSSTPRLASLSSLLLLPLLYTPRPITQCGNNNSQTPTPRASAAFSPSPSLSFSCFSKTESGKSQTSPVSLVNVCACHFFLSPAMSAPKTRLYPCLTVMIDPASSPPSGWPPLRSRSPLLSAVCVWICTVFMCVGEERASTICSLGTLGNSKGA